MVHAKENYTRPVYTIGITAKFLEVCPGTLRIWERKGLIKPVRQGKNRFYSQCDVDHLGQIKDLMQNKGVNIEGVKNILSTTRCWEVKKCNPREKEVCPVYVKYGES